MLLLGCRAQQGAERTSEGPPGTLQHSCRRVGCAGVEGVRVGWCVVRVGGVCWWWCVLVMRLNAGFVCVAANTN
jgi:hypothetical protein